MNYYDELVKEVPLVKKYVPGVENDEIFAHLEAHYQEKNRLQIVVGELIMGLENKFFEIPPEDLAEISEKKQTEENVCDIDLTDDENEKLCQTVTEEPQPSTSGVNVQKTVENKVKMLMDLFPDADPVFFKNFVTENVNNPKGIDDVVAGWLENKNYKKLEEAKQDAVKRELIERKAEEAVGTLNVQLFTCGSRLRVELSRQYDSGDGYNSSRSPMSSSYRSRSPLGRRDSMKLRDDQNRRIDTKGPRNKALAEARRDRYMQKGPSSYKAMSSGGERRSKKGRYSGQYDSRDGYNSSRSPMSSSYRSRSPHGRRADSMKLSRIDTKGRRNGNSRDGYNSSRSALSRKLHHAWVAWYPPNFAFEKLKTHFSKFGIKDVWEACNRKGFAFIKFNDDRGAEKAVRAMNGQIKYDSLLRVELSPGSEGMFRGSGSRGGGMHDGGGRGGRSFGGSGGGFNRGARRDRYMQNGPSSYKDMSSGGGGRSERDRYSGQYDSGDGYYYSRSPMSSSYRSRSPLGRRDSTELRDDQRRSETKGQSDNKALAHNLIEVEKSGGTNQTEHEPDRYEKAKSLAKKFPRYHFGERRQAYTRVAEAMMTIKNIKEENKVTRNELLVDFIEMNEDRWRDDMKTILKLNDYPKDFWTPDEIASNSDDILEFLSKLQEIYSTAYMRSRRNWIGQLD